MNALQVIIANYMLLIKFPTEGGTGFVRGDQYKARACYALTAKQRRKIENESCSVSSSSIESQEGIIDPRENQTKQHALPGEELEKILISEEHPKRLIQISAKLTPEVRADLITFLKGNSEVFAWSYEDMSGIDLEVITQNLSIDPNFKAVSKREELTT